MVPTPLPLRVGAIVSRGGRHRHRWQSARFWLGSPYSCYGGTRCPNQGILYPHAVGNTWRLSVDTSLFVIDILADGSWRPAYIAPKRLGGWTMDVLPKMPPTVEAAVRTWARQYGANVTNRRTPARQFPAQTASSNRTPE